MSTSWLLHLDDRVANGHEKSLRVVQRGEAELRLDGCRPSCFFWAIAVLDQTGDYRMRLPTRPVLELVLLDTPLDSPPIVLADTPGSGSDVASGR